MRGRRSDTEDRTHTQTEEEQQAKKAKKMLEVAIVAARETLASRKKEVEKDVAFIKVFVHQNAKKITIKATSLHPGKNL